MPFTYGQVLDLAKAACPFFKHAYIISLYSMLCHSSHPWFPRCWIEPRLPGKFLKSSSHGCVTPCPHGQVLDRAKAAKSVGGSVASTYDVNEQENEGALQWLANHIMMGLDGEMGETLEEVVDELKRRNVRCVRIEKRATNPRRFFKIGDDPTVYPGLMQTLQGMGLAE
eukprot:1141184-Pelagomonas_calceolata.AAC.2